MATINGSTNNSRYSLTCEYTYTQNASANTSTITAIVYLSGNGYTTISKYWCCTINGVQVTTNKSATVSGKTELGRRTWTVNHNSDGSCTTNISFSFTNRVTAGTYTVSRGEGGANVTLNSLSRPTPPPTNRPSTISLNKTSFVLGTDEVKITISKETNGVTHSVKLSWGGDWKELADNISTSYSFVPSKDFCNQIPNSISGTATIKVETLLNGSWIGEATKNVTFTVPEDVVPSVGIRVTANHTLNGVNIQNETTFTVKPINATGVYGSTIRSYSYRGGNLSGSSSSGGGVTTGGLGAGYYTLTVTVTDTRGRTANASQRVYVYEYNTPTFSCLPTRSNSKGEPLDMGEHIYGQLTYKIYNPNNTNTNEKKYRLLSKEARTTAWTVAKGWTDLTNYSGTETIKFGGTYSILTTYDIKIEVKDSCHLTTMVYRIDTSRVVFNIEKQGIGVGKYWEQGAIDIGGNVFVNGNGKAIQLGTSGSDVYIHNSSSGKYLQLKDDGALRYDNNLIYHEGNTNGPTRGNWFSGGFPRVATDGVMEIGAYVDFHNTNTTTSDFSTRLSANGDNRNTVYLPTGNGTLCLSNQVIGNSGSQTMNVAQGKFTITGDGGYGHLDVAGGFHTRGDSNDIWFERSVKPATWSNSALDLGDSGQRWRNIWAANGTIQTSDKRHKAIIDNINNQDCFNMIKNTDVFSYVMLNKNKEEMDEFERIEETLMNSGKDENIKMGIMAQDILNYDCSKYVLTYSEYIDEETGEIKDYYGIDAYAFSSAIMGALKQEILYRELLQNEVDKIKQDIESLKNNLNGE